MYCEKIKMDKLPDISVKTAELVLSNNWLCILLFKFRVFIIRG